jgi:chloramphenicol-sensitive protein RarD
MDIKPDNKLSGVLYGAAAFTAWGFLPLYWKLLDKVPAIEIIAHRVIWSFVFVGLILMFTKSWRKFTLVLKNKKNLVFILMCSVLITINWFTYIWAVNSDHIIESSIGYYINPLIAVLLGMTVLKEKLNIYQYVSLGLAFVGVVMITIQYGKIPWIALTLAISFGLYGLFKKLIVVESIVGLALETAIITPFALVFITYKQLNGSGALGNGAILTSLLLAGAGVVTAIPLLWFARSTKRVKLSTIGFLQYISPTINLILGVFVFNETFTSADLISFGFIWSALLIYSVSQTELVKYQLPIFRKV